MKEICEEAMDQVTTTGVIKLEGAKNWNVWWLTKDAKAQSLIVTRLSEEVMLHILTCGSANGMWRKLHSVYEQKSDTSIHIVQQQFFQYKYTEYMNKKAIPAFT
ncbi:hypothetical protein QE152_g36763 [Popillia japonica]|uniref:Uncharacterized protein n=1 Tax=Popillia japonica TaxID=7064 RepID=A0AAW1ICH1_POPJA